MFTRRFLKTGRSASILALILCLVTAGVAQTTSGSVAVTVIDPQQASVPEAGITLLNKATGATFEGKTTDSGVHRFPSLAPGEYTITVNAGGFAVSESDVRVLLNQETSITVNLNVAGVTGESVDITAGEEAVVSTTSSQLGASYSSTQVSQLPINGNQNALALLAPGVTTRGGGTAGSGGSVGGARARSNAFNIDGVDNNDVTVTGPSIAVIQDSVAEFTLLQNNFSAEYGSAAAGQFNTITKSGTNEFHGSAFWYVQNKNLNARTSLELDEAFVDASGRVLPKPRFDANRVGGTIGGPIFRDKLFFFGAYEFSNQGEAGTFSFNTPTAAGIQILQGVRGASPTSLGILNLVTPAPSTEFTTDIVDANGDTVTVPIGQVVIPAPEFFNNHQYQINIDYNPRQEDQIRGRYNNSRFRQLQVGDGAVGIFDNDVVYDTKLLSLTEVHTFSPTLVNELRLAAREAITDAPLKDAQFENFPNIAIDDIGLFIGPSGNLPQGGLEQVYQVYDALSYQRGAHSFKFGGEVKRVISSSIFLPRSRGDYIYASLTPFLLDLTPDLGRRGTGGATFTGNNYQYSWFVQDDWKATPNLTLNLGLRYDVVTLPRDSALQALNSVADAPGVITFGVPETDKNNFAPRIGFAYAPSFEDGWLHTVFGNPGQSSIRGGFSVAHDVLFQNLVLLNLPPQIQQEVTVLGDGETGAGFLAGGGIPPGLARSFSRAEARAATASVINDQTAPYTMSWSLGFQREILPATGIEFRYQGTRGVHLPVQQQLNAFVTPRESFQIPTFFSTPSNSQLSNLPNLGQLAAQFPRVRKLNMLLPPGDDPFGAVVTNFSPIGNSIYHGASVSLTRRMSQGLALTAAYTFSKTIDDSTNELNTSAINPRRAQDAFNQRDERGLSAFDHPHRFVSSFVYELPFFNDAQGLTRTFLGGFEVAGILEFESGQPFTAQSGVDSNRNGDGAGDRAFQNPGGVEGTGSGVIALNASGQAVALGSAATVAYVVREPNAQFIQVGPLASLGLSTVGRNTLRSRALKNLDLTLTKNFRWGESYNIQFGAEMFNATNSRNIRIVAPPGNALTTQFAAFANVSSDLFNDYFQSGGQFGGRVIQLRLKFIF